MHPTYHVRHPDDTYSVVAPQPAEVLVDAAITTLNQLGRMVGNSARENNRICAALTAAFSEAAPRATPADAGAGKALTNQRIIEIADQTRTAESRDGDYILPISFAREIEKELVRLSTSGAPVTAEIQQLRVDAGLAALAQEAAESKLAQADAYIEELEAKLAGQSPAPVTAEPAQSIDTPEFRELMVNFGYWVDEEEAEHDECAADLIAYIDKRLAPAPADRDTVRNEALEEAARTVEAERIGFAHDDRQLNKIAHDIRALKSMERAADAKGEQQ